MSAKRIVFLDTETTGLSLGDDIWEIAAIVRDPGMPDVEHLAFVEHDYAKAARLPEAFRVGHARYDETAAIKVGGAARLVAEWTHGAQIVGAVPNFDTERLGIMLKRHGLAPTWSHRLVCVETLTAGHLGRLVGGMGKCADALGVEYDPALAHTAMADARLARDIFDRIVTS